MLCCAGIFERRLDVVTGYCTDNGQDDLNKQNGRRLYRGWRPPNQFPLLRAVDMRNEPNTRLACQSKVDDVHCSRHRRSVYQRHPPATRHCAHHVRKVLYLITLMYTENIQHASCVLRTVITRVSRHFCEPQRCVLATCADDSGSICNAPMYIVTNVDTNCDTVTA
jgi:hypothetical protein